MKIARKLYTSHTDDHSSKENMLSRVGSSIKNTTTKAVSKVKDGYNFVKTHTAKETFDEVKKGTKKGMKAAWKYTKNNPDEAIVLTGSYAIPGALAGKLLKAGKKKEAALVGSIAALPIGEGYIAAKKGIQVARNKDKKNDNKA